VIEMNKKYGKLAVSGVLFLSLLGAPIETDETGYMRRMIDNDQAALQEAKRRTGKLTDESIGYANRMDEYARKIKEIRNGLLEEYPR
jgi:hypothetical protein